VQRCSIHGQPSSSIRPARDHAASDWSLISLLIARTRRRAPCKPLRPSTGARTTSFRQDKAATTCELGVCSFTIDNGAATERRACCYTTRQTTIADPMSLASIVGYSNKEDIEFWDSRSLSPIFFVDTQLHNPLLAANSFITSTLRP
jgi:hypothetical protein